MLKKILTFILFLFLFYLKADLALADFNDGDIVRYNSTLWVLKISPQGEKFKREINSKIISFYPHLKKQKIKNISAADFNSFKENPIVRLENSQDIYKLQISSKKNYFTKRLIKNYDCLTQLNYDAQGIFIINKSEFLNAIGLAKLKCPPVSLSSNPQNQTPTSSNLSQSSLNVSVSIPYFPQNNFLIAGAPNNPVFYLQINNNSDFDAKLLSLKLQTKGLAKTGMFKAFNIRVKDSYPRGNPTSSILPTINFDISEEPIIINAHSSEVIQIDASPFSYAIDYSDITFFIEKSTDIILQSSNNQTFSPNGIFPLEGKTMKIVSRSVGLAKLESSSLGTVKGTRQNPYLIDQGFGDFGVARFKLKEISGYEDVELQYIELRQDGNVFNSIINNLRLIDNRNNQIIARIDNLIGNKAKFLLKDVPGDRRGPSGGYLIPRNLEADFTLVINTLLYPDASYRTINFTLPSDIQIYAKGLSSDNFVPVNQAPGFTYPIGDDDEGSVWLRLNVSNLTFAPSPDSPTGNIAQNKPDTIIARFNIQSSSETFILEELNFSIIGNGSPLPNGAKTFAGNLEVLTSQGQTLLNIIAQDPRLYGTNVQDFQSLTGIITGNPNGEGITWIKNTNFTVPTNSISQIIFKTHTPAVALAQSYRVKINFYQFRGLNSGRIIKSDSPILSPAITILP